jgi:hypothetical protein
MRLDGILLRMYDGLRIALGAVTGRRYKPARLGHARREPDAAAHLFAAETE